MIASIDIDVSKLATYQSGRELVFAKMQGCGNHFIVAAMTEDAAKNFPAQAVKKLSDPHFGVGADGVLLIYHSSDLAEREIHFGVAMYNPDGSRMGMCGNGIRCVAKFTDAYLDKNHLLQSKELTFLVDEVTHIKCRAQSELVNVNMGNGVVIGSGTIQIQPNLAFEYDAVEVPNPHAVIVCAKLPSVDEVKTWGPIIEHHSDFPNRTNVEFVKIHTKDSVEVLVWERGAGMTQACGTAACATVLALHKKRLVKKRCTVGLPGGKLLVEVQTIVESKTGNAVDLLFLTGPQQEIYTGRISL